MAQFSHFAVQAKSKSDILVVKNETSIPLFSNMAKVGEPDNNEVAHINNIISLVNENPTKENVSTLWDLLENLWSRIMYFEMSKVDVMCVATALRNVHGNLDNRCKDLFAHSWYKILFE